MSEETQIGRWLRGLKPLTGYAVTRTLADVEARFWPKVDKQGQIPAHVPEIDSCWVWTRGKNLSHYGHIKIRGKMFMAHRLSWELSVGPIPEDMCVLHKCDNPSCVRPSHMFLGTPAINSDDKVQKGRDYHPAGGLHPNAKLTDQQVAEMKLMLVNGATRGQLAPKFNVSEAAVSLIASGVNWRHVPWPDGPVYPAGRKKAIASERKSA